MQHVLKCKHNLIFSRNLRLKGNLLLTISLFQENLNKVEDIWIKKNQWMHIKNSDIVLNLQDLWHYTFQTSEGTITRKEDEVIDHIKKIWE